MILAVDTSTRYVGIALFDGNSILAEELWLSARYHTVELAQAVADNFQRVGIQPGDLSALAIATGPGSFTGLRIGMAFIKGLAFTHQLPIIGVPTLDITAKAVPVQEKPLAAVLKAGRERLAVGWYQPEGEQWRSTGKLENLSAAAFLERIPEEIIVTGELSGKIRAQLAEKEGVELASPLEAIRSPKYLAGLAWERWSAGESEDPVSLKPLYLHRTDPE